MPVARALFEHWSRNVEDIAYYKTIKSSHFHNGMECGKVRKNHKLLLKLTEMYINVQTPPASNFTTVSVQKWEQVCFWHILTIFFNAYKQAEK